MIKNGPRAATAAMALLLAISFAVSLQSQYGLALDHDSSVLFAVAFPVTLDVVTMTLLSMLFRALSNQKTWLLQVGLWCYLLISLVGCHRDGVWGHR